MCYSSVPEALLIIIATFPNRSHLILSQDCTAQFTALPSDNIGDSSQPFMGFFTFRNNKNSLWFAKLLLKHKKEPFHKKVHYFVIFAMLSPVERDFRLIFEKWF